jgi:crotonobetainyl-CoA:carnitine CoA-transferase CaiB-like acyl-CoA transferase
MDATLAGHERAGAAEVAEAATFPLGALRLLDLSRAISGRFIGSMLGNLGADVVKV